MSVSNPGSCGSPRLLGQHLAKLVSFRFSEKLHLKTKLETGLRKTPCVNLWPPHASHAHIHLWSQTYAQTQKWMNQLQRFSRFCESSVSSCLRANWKANISGHFIAELTLHKTNLKTHGCLPESVTSKIRLEVTSTSQVYPKYLNPKDSRGTGENIPSGGHGSIHVKEKWMLKLICKFDVKPRKKLQLKVRYIFRSILRMKQESCRTETELQHYKEWRQIHCLIGVPHHLCCGCSFHQRTQGFLQNVLEEKRESGRVENGKFQLVHNGEKQNNLYLSITSVHLCPLCSL